MTAWAAPLDRLSGVTIADWRDDTDFSSGSIEWSLSAGYRVEFGSRSFTLPVSGGFGSYAETERVDRFIAELRNPGADG